MKLMCCVKVNNRLCSEDTAKNRAAKSCLSIGKKTKEDEKVYIILQTLQNKQGTKYKMTDNVEKVFTNCIDEGKMTIRFKEPPHDLLVLCDALQLKSFARCMKLGFTNKLTDSILSLPDLKPKVVTDAFKTKTTVKNPDKYPILEGFPRVTKELILSGLGRRSFDRNILKLQNLRMLDLSDNQIKSLPKELGSLPHLQGLNLSQNLIGKAPKSKWVWMDGVVTKNLRLLDLSSNQMTEVPERIGNLSGLVTLRLNKNSIKYLPQSLGRLEALKSLDVSVNELVVLPGSVRNLRLNTLNIANNNFVKSNSINIYKLTILSLVETAARVVLKSRIHFDESTIPFTLVNYLAKAEYCFCGNACFDSYIRESKMIESFLCYEFITTTSGNSSIPLDCYFCSARCYRRAGCIS